MPNTPGIGALYARGSSTSVPRQPIPAALRSSFSKRPLRAAEDKRGGKEKAKRQLANQGHFQRNSSWHLAKLSASMRDELLPAFRISPPPFFQLQPFPCGSHCSRALLNCPPERPASAPSGADTPAATCRRGATGWDKSTILITSCLGKAERGLCLLTRLSQGYIHTQDKSGCQEKAMLLERTVRSIKKALGCWLF